MIGLLKIFQSRLWMNGIRLGFCGRVLSQFSYFPTGTCGKTQFKNVCGSTKIYLTAINYNEDDLEYRRKD